MITLRPEKERGHADHGWLKSAHTFSFADYHDPRHMGFRSLRVINEDRVAPGAGFGMHPHRDMEIISLVLEGSLAHKDNLGGGAVLRPYEIQHMSAGSGIRHQEFNPDPELPVHFLQIWIEPSKTNLPPCYQQKKIPLEAGSRTYLLAGPPGLHALVNINQDALLYLTHLQKNESHIHPLTQSRAAWVQVLRGNLLLNGMALGEGDGSSVSHEHEFTLTATTNAEALVFDLA